LVNGHIDDVLGAEDVGLDGLERIVFRGRHLLEGRGVDDDVHSVEGPAEPLLVADVPDEVAHAGVLARRKRLGHLVLFQLVAAEDDETPGGVAPENGPRKHSSERPRASRDEYVLAVQHRRPFRDSPPQVVREDGTSN